MEVHLLSVYAVIIKHEGDVYKRQTLLLTMTISSPVKAAELQTSTTVDRSQITLPLSEIGRASCRERV